MTRVSWRQLKSANGPEKWVKCFLVSNIEKEKKNPEIVINFCISVKLLNKELIGGLLLVNLFV